MINNTNKNANTISNLTIKIFSSNNILLARDTSNKLIYYSKKGKPAFWNDD